MKEYIATFYSHYGAMQFHRILKNRGLEGTVMPVPRFLSSSCGTCVKFSAETDASLPEPGEEVEQLVRLKEESYIILYHADD